MAFRVLLDTCALYPMILRDTLLSLAEADLYQPMWSADILEELERNLHDVTTEEKAARVVTVMAAAFPNAEVADYEQLEPTLRCDEKDRHVLAAAIRGDAGALVTFNVDDFSPESTADYSIDTRTPDDFLLDLLDLAPPLVLRVLEHQASRYKLEPRTLHGLLGSLERAGAPLFADEVRRRLDAP